MHGTNMQEKGRIQGIKRIFLKCQIRIRFWGYLKAYGFNVP